MCPAGVRASAKGPRTLRTILVSDIRGSEGNEPERRDEGQCQRMCSDEAAPLLLQSVKAQGIPCPKVVPYTLLILFPGNILNKNGCPSSFHVLVNILTSPF